MPLLDQPLHAAILPLRLGRAPFEVRPPYLIDYPELNAHFYGQATDPPSPADRVRLDVIADHFADALESALTTSRFLDPFARTQVGDPWPGYAAHMIGSSATLRSKVEESPGWWPSLDPIVAAYWPVAHTVAT